MPENELRSALVLTAQPVLASNPFVITQLGNSVNKKGNLEQLAQDQYFALILLGGELKDFRPVSGTWSAELINVIRASVLSREIYPVLKRSNARVAYAPNKQQRKEPY